MSAIPDNMSYISRHDGRNPGWQVRFQTAGETKFFSDATHGGEGGARCAAVEWRNQMKRERPGLAVGFSGRAKKEWGKPRSNNPTGVDCVTILPRYENGTIYVKAQWRDGDAALRYKCFTVGKKYTFEEAFAAAVKERYAHTGRKKEYDVGKLDFAKARTAYENVITKMEEKGASPCRY